MRGGQRERAKALQVAMQCLGCKLSMKWRLVRSESGQEPEGRMQSEGTARARARGQRHARLVGGIIRSHRT